MDSYDILGVTRESSDKEIEIAYEDLKRKYDPSFNTSIHAYKKYREILKAYENIKDEQRRKMYDLKDNKSDVKEVSKSYRLYDFNNVSKEIIEKVIDYSRVEDLNEVKCKDIELNVKVSYLYRLLNLRYDLEYQHRVRCSNCRDFVVCPGCNGDKVVEYREHLVWCPRCQGTGKISVNCKSCGNSGYKVEKNIVSIYVDEDVKEFKGQGDEYSNNLKSNLKVIFDYYDKENIKIDGDNIYINYYLSKEETLKGINREYFSEFGVFKLVVPSFVENEYKQEFSFNNKNLIFTFYNEKYDGEDKKMSLLISKEFKDKDIYFNEDYSFCSEFETSECSKRVKCDNKIIVNGFGNSGKYGGKDGNLIIDVYFNKGDILYTNNLQVIETSKLFNILGGRVGDFSHKGFKGVNGLVKKKDTYYLLSGLSKEKNKFKDYYIFKVISVLLWCLLPLLVFIHPYNQTMFVVLISVLVGYFVLLNILMEVEV